MAKFSVGDFVCVSEPIAYNYNLSRDTAQAIGKVTRQESNGIVVIEFPKRFTAIGTTRFWPDEVRKANAYEGMMAFWDPEEENRRIFSPTNQSPLPALTYPEQRRITAAREKQEQANLKMEDF